MINQSTLQGGWNEIKGKLRTRWGQLTNDDVKTFDGNVDQLVGLIQRRTGEARPEVEKYLAELTNKGSSLVAQVSEGARQYVEQASESVKDGSKWAADAVSDGYDNAQEIVRYRPGQSIAACFGVGVLLGLVIGASMRRS